jgi:hypothetical protein
VLGDASEDLHLTNVSRTAGQDSFLLVGLDEASRPAAVEVITTQEPRFTKPLPLEAGVQLNEDQPAPAIDLGSGEWIVAVQGCVVVDGRCPTAKAVFFKINPTRGQAQRLGEMPLERTTFSFIGRVSDHQVALEVGQNDGPSAVSAPVDPTTADLPQALYRSKVAILNIDSGELTDAAWAPPDLPYDALVGSNDPNASRPLRFVCADGGLIRVLETHAAKSSIWTSLTTVPVDKTTPSTVELSLPEGSAPTSLLCGGDGTTALVMLDAATKSISVSSISPDGTLTDATSATWQYSISNLLTLGSSVLLVAKPFPDMTAISEAMDHGQTAQELTDAGPAPQLLVFRNGMWTEPDVSLRPGQSALLSESGNRLLIFEGDQFEEASL